MAVATGAVTISAGVVGSDSVAVSGKQRPRLAAWVVLAVSQVVTQSMAKDCTRSYWLTTVRAVAAMGGGAGGKMACQTSTIPFSDALRTSTIRMMRPPPRLPEASRRFQVLVIAGIRWPCAQ